MEYIFIAMLSNGIISERVYGQIDCQTLSESVKFIDRNVTSICVEVEKKRKRL